MRQIVKKKTFECINKTISLNNSPYPNQRNQNLILFVGYKQLDIVQFVPVLFSARDDVEKKKIQKSEDGVTTVVSRVAHEFNYLINAEEENR